MHRARGVPASSCQARVGGGPRSCSQVSAPFSDVSSGCRGQLRTTRQTRPLRCCAVRHSWQDARFWPGVAVNGPRLCPGAPAHAATLSVSGTATGWLLTGEARCRHFCFSRHFFLFLFSARRAHTHNCQNATTRGHPAATALDCHRTYRAEKKVAALRVVRSRLFVVPGPRLRALAHSRTRRLGRALNKGRELDWLIDHALLRTRLTGVPFMS